MQDSYVGRLFRFPNLIKKIQVDILRYKSPKTEEKVWL